MEAKMIRFFADKLQKWRKPSGKKEQFSQIRAEYQNRYNSASLLCTTAFCLSVGLFVLLFSLPPIATITKLSHNMCLIWRLYFVGISCFSSFIFIFRKFTTKHPLFFLYTVFVIMYAFTASVNLSGSRSVTYSVTTAVVIIVPTLAYDKPWRVNLFNYSMLGICLILSFFLKNRKLFFYDVENGLVVGFLGYMVGAFTRHSQLKYIAMKEQTFNIEMQQANAKNEAKSKFLANVSHEIRTPLNTILGLDEMILRESKEPKTLSYAAELQNSGRTLLGLISDILDISKIESGKMEIVPVTYDVRSLVTDLATIIRQKANQKGLKFVIDADSTIPEILSGDEQRVKQCILNLLTNAVKYTHTGHVTFSLNWEKIKEQKAILLKVRVEDTGIGIHDEDMQKMFNAFDRIDKKENYAVEGSGLGLAITKSLLEQMGSQIQVESKVGKGSVFYFDLPQTVISWAESGDFSSLNKELTLARTEYHESFHAPAAHILAVDDTKMNLIVFRGLLKKTLVQIDTAASGYEAEELFKCRNYDIIFIDYRMPDMDGIETLHALQADAEAEQKHLPPCIALTANAISGAKDKYLAAGFNDYLSKPVESAKLERLLVKYLPGKLVYPVNDQGEVSATPLERD